MGFWPSYDFFKQSGVLQKYEDGDLKRNQGHQYLIYFFSSIWYTWIWYTQASKYKKLEKNGHYDTPFQASSQNFHFLVYHLSRENV